MIDKSSLTSIEDLHRMKVDGIITEAEFEQSKQRILFGSKPASSTAAKGGEYLTWAILSLKRYVDFKGRSSRKEFWLFFFAVNVLLAVYFILAMFDESDFLGRPGPLASLMVGMIWLTLLGATLPYLALQVRRLQDQGRSGWLALLNLVPFVGSLAILTLMALPGTPGDNSYGPDPRLNPPI